MTQSPEPKIYENLYIDFIRQINLVTESGDRSPSPRSTEHRHQNDKIKITSLGDHHRAPVT